MNYIQKNIMDVIERWELTHHVGLEGHERDDLLFSLSQLFEDLNN